MATQQELAENLYCTTRLSQEEISTLVGINRKTLYSWTKEKNWQRQPHAEEVVPLRLLSKCYNQIEYLLNESEYIDPEYCQHHFKGISVMIRAVNSLKPKKKENLHATVMTAFMKQIHETAPTLAESLLPFVCQFLETHNLEMPSTPPPPIKTTVEDAPQKNLTDDFINHQSQTKPESTPSRSMKCAVPRKRLIKPKTNKSKTQLPKPAQTAPTKNITPTIKLKNNIAHQNNHISDRTPLPNAAPAFGVHGASHNDNKLLQNKRNDNIINNLEKQNNNTTPAPHTPFFNFSMGNEPHSNAALRPEFRTPFSEFLKDIPHPLAALRTEFRAPFFHFSTGNYSRPNATLRTDFRPNCMP